MKSIVTNVSCDKCGLETGASEFSFQTGTGIDASGNTCRRYLDFDLCPTCQEKLLHKFIDLLWGANNIRYLIREFVPKSRETES